MRKIDLKEDIPISKINKVEKPDLVPLVFEHA